MIVATFDFDGTLTHRDTLFPFLRFISGLPVFAVKSIRVVPVLCRLAVRNIDNQRAKETVLRRFISGRSRRELVELGIKFSEERISRMLRTEAINRLSWHQRQGHTCILVSASLDVYLEHWSRSLKFDALACSRLDYDDEGRATGALFGRNCHGAEKLRRLHELIDAAKITELYAYGDSSGDRELLAAADHAYFRKFSG